MTLLKEKAVNKNTVNEVCKPAKLNRASFYVHYSDCCALLESIEDELEMLYRHLCNGLMYVAVDGHGKYSMEAVVGVVNRIVKKQPVALSIGLDFPFTPCYYDLRIFSNSGGGHPAKVCDKAAKDFAGLSHEAHG